MLRIAVVGTGYVGLTAGACFAHLGHDVTCIDIDADKVRGLSRGLVPIMEEGLDRLVEEGLAAGRLSFTWDLAAGVDGADLAFLCVPTPMDTEGSADLSALRAACADLGGMLDPGVVVVVKSTGPVGTTRNLPEFLGRDDLPVASNPEFLREGTAVEDFLRPDRLVVGADSGEVVDRVVAAYGGLDVPVVRTDPTAAEMVKYASNAYLVTRLSFVNAIAAICEGLSADVDAVVRGMGLDARIGPAYLRPGPGWGGSCFPKDTRSLVESARRGGYEFRFLEAAIAVNEEQFDRVVSKASDTVGGSLFGRRVAVWGLTFKAGTDDHRDSPAVAIVERLLAAGAEVVACDPTVAFAGPDLPAGLVVVADPVDACRGAETLVVLTEWSSFGDVDPGVVGDVMAGRIVVDTRGVLDRVAWEAVGLEVRGIGR